MPKRNVMKYDKGASRHCDHAHDMNPDRPAFGDAVCFIDKEFDNCPERLINDIGGPVTRAHARLSQHYMIMEKTIKKLNRLDRLKSWEVLFELEEIEKLLAAHNKASKCDPKNR